MGGLRAFAVADTSYEIYVRQKGSDRWMLDSRYGTSDKQEAIDDAKEIVRQSHIEAVRVVREIHNAETNTTRDTVVFTTSGKKGADGGGGPKRRGDDDDDDGPSLGGRRSSPATTRTTSRRPSAAGSSARRGISRSLPTGPGSTWAPRCG